jgi:hypothetical protein
MVNSPFNRKTGLVKKEKSYTGIGATAGQCSYTLSLVQPIEQLQMMFKGRVPRNKTGNLLSKIQAWIGSSVVTIKAGSESNLI